MRGDRGSVTAEFAVALPGVVLLLGLLLGALSVGSLAVRVQDAAGLAARSIARGAGGSETQAAARSLVPAMTLSRADRDGLVCVVAEARPDGMLSFLSVRAESCALGEG
jgi:hypothetical protein